MNMRDYTTKHIDTNSDFIAFIEELPASIGGLMVENVALLDDT